MLRFRQMISAVHNPLHHDRHRIRRETYTAQPSAALAEWTTLAGQALRLPAYLRLVETSCRGTDSIAVHYRTDA